MAKFIVFSSMFLKMLLVLMMIPQPLFSQIPEEPVSVLSPNAASLGVYGNTPVSLYTGTPVINIPLYEMAYFGYTLPISLSYHAAGVRPDQRPGWVGLGWSLNAGGAITREVKEYPDDYKHLKISKHQGYYYTHDILDDYSWSSRDYLRKIAQEQPLRHGGIRIPEEKDYKDTEPDEFSFHFPGYNGKFYLDHQGNWQVLCDKPVKVSFNNTFLDVPFSANGTTSKYFGYPRTFSGFTITTEEGVQYVFGGDTTAIDYSIGFFHQYDDAWIATAWYLTKIILPNGQDISLSYERGDFINQMYIAVYGVSYHEASSEEYMNPKCDTTAPLPLIEECYTGKLIAPVYLKEIKSGDETIGFDKTLSTELNYTEDIYESKYDDWHDIYLANHELGPDREWPRDFLLILKGDGTLDYPEYLDNMRWYELSTITVKNRQTGTVKTIDFNYNNQETERLMLLGIKEAGPDNIQKKSHQFSYDNPGLLPGYLSNKTDHWGFYNGTEAKLNTGHYYVNRNPKAAYLKYGILNKIVYPTGGYTEFEFEPHDYRKQISIIRDACFDLGSNNLSGGLRIKRITDYTSEKMKTGERTYFYVSDYLQHKTTANQSSGVLGGQIQYSFDYIAYAYTSDDLKVMRTIFSSVSVLPCYNASGSHIGYSEVIEKRDDNAFTRYLYTNFDNGYLDEPAINVIQLSRTPYEPYSSKAQDRGLLQLKEEYNAYGSMIRSTKSTYEKNDNSLHNYVRSMKASCETVCRDVEDRYDEGATYKIYTYSWLPKSVETVVYDLNGRNPVNTTVDYSYTTNPKGLLHIKEQNQGDASGATIKTEYRYASDVEHADMVRKNMTGVPLETITYRDGLVTNALLTPYRKEGDLLLPDFQSRLKVSMPISDYIKYNVANENTDHRLQKYLTFDVYDSYGNLLQYTRRDGLTVSCIWGYNGQYLVAKIENATYDQVATALGGKSVTERISNESTLSTSDITLINSLRSNVSLKNSMITNYTYKSSVGLSSQTDPNGITTYFEYDDLGRLKRVRDYERNVLKEYEYRYFNE